MGDKVMQKSSQSQGDSGLNPSESPEDSGQTLAARLVDS